ncbi:hypothetical protein H261_12506 [Paramagnetospirillum caucaseum]|uniref:Flavinylation-associated cytochrome domain-containing protein n=1 Tax=Paramagnetospirillum caucaseum TaxID=1244869 RepID=M2ZQQ7_9PROT|nr:DUF4405 domain-containing protein [Paramagnetospirillum caucaseum]EME69647.1 hypothetical protein H261_12506 [Paramagnetospirillum caucaseum]
MTCFETALRRYATPGTAILSVVVGITGVILFFHLAKGPVEAIHEWLGMAFAAVAVLHVVRHRGSFAQMLRQRHMQVLAGVTVLGIAAFVALVPPKPPGNPLIRLARAAERAPIAQLAPVIGSSTDEVLARLKRAGITAEPGDTVATLASVHHRQPGELFASILPPPSR